MNRSRMRYWITSHAKKSDLNRFDVELYSHYAILLCELVKVTTLQSLPENLAIHSESLCHDEVSLQQIQQIADLLLDMKHKRVSSKREHLILTCSCGRLATYSYQYHRYECRRCRKLCYAHHGDHWPMGQLACSLVRFRRKQCHEVFQDKWVEPIGDINLAYQRLMDLTGLSRNNLHFGLIDNLVDAQRVLTTLENHAPQPAVA